MDTSRIQEIILKVNGNDAEKTIKHIQGVIEKAKKAKEDLAKEDTSKWEIRSGRNGSSLIEK